MHDLKDKKVIYIIVIVCLYWNNLAWALFTNPSFSSLPKNNSYFYPPQLHRFPNSLSPVNFNTNPAFIPDASETTKDELMGLIRDYLNRVNPGEYSGSTIYKYLQLNIQGKTKRVPIDIEVYKTSQGSFLLNKFSIKVDNFSFLFDELGNLRTVTMPKDQVLWVKREDLLNFNILKELLNPEQTVLLGNDKKLALEKTINDIIAGNLPRGAFYLSKQKQTILDSMYKDLPKATDVLNYLSNLVNGLEFANTRTENPPYHFSVKTTKVVVVGDRVTMEDRFMVDYKAYEEETGIGGTIISQKIIDEVSLEWRTKNGEINWFRVKIKTRGGEEINKVITVNREKMELQYADEKMNITYQVPGLKNLGFNWRLTTKDKDGDPKTPDRKLERLEMKIMLPSDTNYTVKDIVRLDQKSGNLVNFGITDDSSAGTSATDKRVENLIEEAVKDLEKFRRLNDDFDPNKVSLSQEALSEFIAWFGQMSGGIEKGLGHVNVLAKALRYVADTSKAFVSYEPLFADPEHDRSFFVSPEQGEEEIIGGNYDESRREVETWLRIMVERGFIKEIDIYGTPEKPGILGKLQEYYGKTGGRVGQIDWTYYTGKPEQLTPEVLASAGYWKQAFITYLKQGFPQLVAGADANLPPILPGQLTSQFSGWEFDFLDGIALATILGVTAVSLGVGRGLLFRAFPGLRNWSFFSMLAGEEVANATLGARIAAMVYGAVSRASTFALAGPYINFLQTGEFGDGIGNFIGGLGETFVTGLIYAGIFGYAFPMVKYLRGEGGRGKDVLNIFAFRNLAMMLGSEIMIEEWALQIAYERLSALYLKSGLAKSSETAKALARSTLASDEFYGNLAEIYNPLEIGLMFPSKSNIFGYKVNNFKIFTAIHLAVLAAAMVKAAVD